MLNRVTLIGNLGADVETRYMPNGNAVVTMSLATTRRWKDKQSNERKEETEWHRITMFGKLAEIAEQYVKKVCVSQYSTGIIADQMIMLDGKPEGTQSNIRAGEPPRESQSNQPSAPQGNPNMPEPPNYDDFDDDIPFN
jgi:single-strand DNA-binding protein